MYMYLRSRHRNVAAFDGDELEDVLLEHGRRALREAAVLRLELPLVGLLDVAEDFAALLGDHADVDVAARTQIVEDASPDCLDHESLPLLHGHVVLVLRLQDGHRAEAAAGMEVKGSMSVEPCG